MISQLLNWGFHNTLNTKLEEKLKNQQSFSTHHGIIRPDGDVVAIYIHVDAVEEWVQPLSANGIGLHCEML